MRPAAPSCCAPDRRHEPAPGGPAAARRGLGARRGADVFALAGNGLVLTLLFFALQSPDVALSEMTVGTVATPLLFLAALTAIRITKERK